MICQAILQSWSFLTDKNSVLDGAGIGVIDLSVKKNAIEAEDMAVAVDFHFFLTSGFLLHPPALSCNKEIGETKARILQVKRNMARTKPFFNHRKL